jgi:ABC-type nitrate/sulfonate/bicarbonate transport system permease component
MSLTLRERIPGFLLILFALVVWQLVPSAGLVDPRFLPPVTAVAGSIADNAPQLVGATLTTLRGWILGFLVAALIGVSLGALMGFWSRADDALNVVVELLRPMPSVATIPIAIVLLGLGDPMKLSVAAFASTWPVLIGTVYGVRATDPRYIDAARTLGCGPRDIVRKIVLPAAAPAVASGLRVASATALILVVTTEMVASPSGLGNLIVTAMFSARPELVFGAVVLVAIVGYVLNEGITRIEAWALGWHYRRARLEQGVL